MKNLIEKLFWSFYRWFNDVFLMFFKRIFWKIRYGFDISDTWSLDYSLCKWLLPRLKYLKKVNMGFPCGNDLEGHPMTWEMWNYYLSLIIYWCKYVSEDDEPIYKPDYKGDKYPEWRSEENRIKKRTFDLGKKCFDTYFYNLWW